MTAKRRKWCCDILVHVIKTIRKNYRNLDLVTAFFVSVLLISNIADSKIIALGPFSIGGGTFLFPISYIFGDILTEVYGYKSSRRVIWIGFLTNFCMALTFMIIGALPPAHDWENQKAFEAILGLTPRIVLASLIAFLIGEFSNSFVLAKMKIFSKGRFLWTRTIGSTIVGELADTIVFCLIAFTGVLPFTLVTSIIISGYLFKLAIEVLFTPVTYFVVNKLKKIEDEDYYDYKTNFNPFVLKA